MIIEMYPVYWNVNLWNKKKKFANLNPNFLRANFYQVRSISEMFYLRFIVRLSSKIRSNMVDFDARDVKIFEKSHDGTLR